MRDHYRTARTAVKRLMPHSLQSMYDPHDFLVDAVVELMANPERFIEKGPSLLTLVARRRMIDAVRSPRSRSMSFEVDVIDGQPSAQLEHDAAELRARMLGRAAHPEEWIVVDLRCRGHTLPEIARLRGVGSRQLQGFWKEFREVHQPF